MKAVHPDQLKEWDVVIVETIQETNLESAFTYGSPISIWPQRQYVKLKAFKEQSEKWRLYLLEDLGDRTWMFFERKNEEIQ